MPCASCCAEVHFLRLMPSVVMAAYKRAGAPPHDCRPRSGHHPGRVSVSMLSKIRRVAGVMCFVVVAAAFTSSCAPNERETLNARQLETPRFTPPPPGPGTAASIDQIAADFGGPGGTALLLRLVP